MSYFRAAVFAALAVFAGGAPALANDITLTSKDGAVEINGTLLGFDGEFYRVDTLYGELTVDGTGVTCDGPGCPNLLDYVAEVTISGAASMADVLMPALIEAYALRSNYTVARKNHASDSFTYELSEADGSSVVARFHFRASSTDEGFADLLADEADITMSLREIRPSEAERGYEAGLGDLRGRNRSRVLSLDALVPILAAGNPVKSVTPVELAQVFSGEITNWAALGGADAPIALHVPGLQSGLLQTVEDQLISPSRKTLSDDVQYHDQISSLVGAVARDPFAMGIATYSTTQAATRLPLAGGCGFKVHATRRGIKTEDYPLTAPMFLYLPARRLPKVARDFLAYTRGPAAQIVIRRAGFVDQATEEVTIGMQGERMANAITQAGPEVPLEDLQEMVAQLGTMNRLTTTFRFKPGVTALDAQSLSNVHQLSRALEQGTYDGRELVFVGFSDGEGSAKANREIAIRRAVAVKSAVLDAAETANLDRVQISVTGYGEAMPMACDNSAWGRQVNRRVEIWLR